MKYNIFSYLFLKGNYNKLNMPRKPNPICINIPKQNQDIKDLLKNIPENSKYIIINYSWFYDYYKILNLISSTSMVTYSPEEKTKDIVEFTSINVDTAVVIKIKIIKTNIVKKFTIGFEHDIPFSKFNNNLLLFVLEENTLTIKYNYDTILNVIEYNNDKFFTLDNKIKNDEQKNNNEQEIDNEHENYNDEIYDSDEERCKNSDDEYETNNVQEIEQFEKGQVRFTLVTEEKFNIKQISSYKKINPDILKNVVCYLSIEFENLKNYIKKLGKSKINFNIENGELTMSTVSGKNNKKCLITTNICYVMTKYKNRKIQFSIMGQHFTELKSLPINFSIVSGPDKKIFKNIELKVVVDEKEYEPNYGITISPGNLTNSNRMVDNFDIYNSILFYINENKDNHPILNTI